MAASLGITPDGLTIWQDGRTVLHVPRDRLTDLLVRIATALAAPQDPNA